MTLDRNPIRRFAIEFSKPPLVLVLACLAGCSGNNIPRMSFDTQAMASKAIEDFDTDNDGVLSSAELEPCPSLLASLDRLDTNDDGNVSEEELRTRLDHYAELSKYIATTASVSWKGEPLEGAKVELAPASFMGPERLVLAAVTDESGSCFPISEEKMLPGIPIGFYTVTISHPQRDIAETIGIEVADDVPDGSRLDFDLPLRRRR